ncbi:MAG: hypothetical protein L0Y56_10170, partial [Nitrospira sp.]|nr:hypothetical protein [Nitrospira sp.]
FDNAQDRQQTTDNRPKWYDQISLTSDEHQAIDQGLDRILDLELRELIQRIRVKATKREKLK